MAAETGSTSLLDRANVAFRLATSQPAKGRAAAERVAEDAATSDAPDASDALVVALRGASWAARELFDHGAATALIDRAVAVAERHSLDQRLGECLLTRSSINLERGRHGAARADLDRAATIAPHQVGAEVAVSLGIIEQKVGHYAAAIASYGRALDLASTDQVDVRFKALSNGAICAARLSRHDQAAEMIDAAVEVAARASAVYVAHAAHNRAVLAAERGDPTRALRFFDEALELWQAAELLPAEHHLEKAETLLALRLLDEADAAVGAAVDGLAGRDGAALLLAEGLLLAGSVAGLRARHGEAVDLHERAAAIFAEQGRSGWWAVAAHAAIANRLAAGDPAPGAADQLRRVERELDRAGHVSGRIDAALTAARVARRRARSGLAPAADAYRRCAELGLRGTALQRIQGWVARTEHADLRGDGRAVSRAALAGLKTLDEYRATFESIELRARATTYGEVMAGAGLRWAIAGGRPERVWFWLERTRAVALAEPAGFGTDDGTEVALGRLRAAAARAAELEGEAGGGPDAQREQAGAARELAAAERELRALSWKRSRQAGGPTAPAVPTLGASPTAATLARLRADLGSAGLVQYGVADGQIVAVAVASGRRVLARLGSHDEMAAAARQLAFALRRLARARPGRGASAAIDAIDAALARIDGLLVDRRLRAAVDGCDRLVVVPPTDLIGVPWSALTTLAGRDLVVAPSATAWWVTGRRRPSPGGRTVALAGPALAHADGEVARVAAAHPETMVLSGAEATGAAFAEHAEGATTVHVAAHGRLRADSPTFSSFQLADGPYTVHDVQRLSSPPHRWVLAACDLGGPGDRPGPDLEGIVAALLGGGAGAVVAAVVPVPDSSTPDLMAALHHRLAAGDSTARALRLARDQLDPRAPLDRLTQVAFTCFGAG